MFRAWIGEFVDSTGAVVASASVLKDPEKIGIKTASMVKMIQNILIGPIASLSVVLIHGKKYLRLLILWENCKNL